MDEEKITSDIIEQANANASEAYLKPRNLAVISALSGAMSLGGVLVAFALLATGSVVLGISGCVFAVLVVIFCPRLVVPNRNYGKYRSRAFDELGWCSYCHGHHMYKQCQLRKKDRSSRG